MRFTKFTWFAICLLVVIAVLATPWLYSRWAFSHQRLPVGTWTAADGSATLQISNNTVTITYDWRGHVAKTSGQAQFIGWNRIMIRNGPYDGGGQGPFSFDLAASRDELTWTIPNSPGETYKRVKD